MGCRTPIGSPPTGTTPVPSTPEENPSQNAETVRRLATRRKVRLLSLVTLLGLLLLSCVLSLLIGAKPMSLDTGWHALVAPTGTGDDLIVRELRIPRTAIGALIGCALGLAGALTQGHTRNPIADPGILGITHGAGLAVVLATYIFGVTHLLGFIWFGFAGAILGAVAVFAIGSTVRGGATPMTLALAGAAVSALLQAIIYALVLLDAKSLDTFRFWKVGSIAHTNLAVVWQVLPFLVVGVVLGLANASSLNALSLGEDLARSLGHRVQWARRLGIAAIAILVGASVAVCGPIGFVGLVVPHVCRLLSGPDHRWLLPFSAVTGGSLVLLADVMGRVVARPSEIEVGVMLALIGAPFFIALVRRRKLVKL